MICHNIESELIDQEIDQDSPASKVKFLVEALIPDPTIFAPLARSTETVNKPSARNTKP